MANPCKRLPYGKGWPRQLFSPLDCLLHRQEMMDPRRTVYPSVRVKVGDGHRLSYFICEFLIIVGIYAGPLGRLALQGIDAQHLCLACTALTGCCTATLGGCRDTQFDNIITCRLPCNIFPCGWWGQPESCGKDVTPHCGQPESTGQLCTDQLCAVQACIGQVCNRQFCIGQVRIGQVCIGEVCIGQVCTEQVCTEQVCTMQACIVQVYLLQNCTTQVCSGQICAGQICAGQSCATQVRNGQVRLTQVYIGKVL